MTYETEAGGEQQGCPGVKAPALFCMLPPPGQGSFFPGSRIKIRIYGNCRNVRSAAAEVIGNTGKGHTHTHTHTHTILAT